jgi:hydroxyacylglutathione hydrolase
MLLRRYYDDSLAQASYLAACDHAKVGIIIDPNRDVDFYIEAAAREKIQIVGVTETHIHADFVSGARELAKRTGATLYLSECGTDDWQYRFLDEATPVRTGSLIEVGDVRIEVVHTPGHTPEHVSFLLTDTSVADEPMGALTGDFIFVGDVGRPDLLERAAGMRGTMEAGARQLFASLQEFKKRPDYLQIWPGHGAGSACGKALGAMPQSTLGYERLFNWALAENDEEAFVAHVLSGQPEPPAYFARMKHVNRDGPAPRSTTIPEVVDARAIEKAVSSGVTVVDTRSTQDFAARHAKGTINIPRNKSFLNWTGSLVTYDQPVYFIAPSDDASRSHLARDLSLIGFENIAGIFPSDAFNTLSLPSEITAQREVSDVIASNGATVLDVRGRSEYEAGHIPNAVNIPVGELERRLDEVPEGKLIVHCQGGSRSAMAASILLRSGRDDVSNLSGGFSQWGREGHPVERGNAQD